MMTDDIINECLDEMNRLTNDLFENPNVRYYGYTQYCGPDGVPHVHEFGNVANSLPAAGGIREPLADVSQEGDTVRAVVEIPGVEKKDIKLECSPDELSISVDTEARKYAKTLKLPADVDMDSAKASYNNGILEVTMKSKERCVPSKPIEIQ